MSTLLAIPTEEAKLQDEVITIPQGSLGTILVEPGQIGSINPTLHVLLGITPVELGQTGSIALIPTQEANVIIVPTGIRFDKIPVGRTLDPPTQDLQAVDPPPDLLTEAARVEVVVAEAVVEADVASRLAKTSK